MIQFLLAAASTIASLAIAVAAFMIAIRSFKNIAKENMKTPLRIQEVAEQSLRMERRPAKHINSLAEAAVMLGVKALMLFDQQGFLIETYNMAEDQSIKVAASLAELINMIKKLGFPTETVIFKNGAISFIVELKRVGDVTPYCLAISDSVLTINFDYIRKVLWEYVMNVIDRKR